MVVLTETMKKMLAEQLPFLATTNEHNHPQIGPKGSLQVWDDSHLIYTEYTGKQALHNLQSNGHAAVAVVNHKLVKAFALKESLICIKMTKLPKRPKRKACPVVFSLLLSTSKEFINSMQPKRLVA